MKNKILSVISCKTRYEIVKLLITNETLCVCELEELLEISQANSSKHLKKLSDVGIVEANKQGKYVYFRLAPQFIEENYKLIEYISQGEVNEKDSVIRKRGCK